MSRTQIHLTMENNNKVNSVIGFNANNNGACFEFLFNKLSGNEKQSNNAPDFDFLTEFDNSPLYNLSNNDPSFKKIEESTYTLDDLLDFVSDIPENADDSLNNMSFDLLSGEPQAPYTEVLMDTALDSPLSASSEESCSLDDLLFNDEGLTEELQFSEEPTTEVLDSSTNVEIDNIIEPTQDATNISALALVLQQNSLHNQPQFSSDDLNTLCALFLQNQAPSDAGDESNNSFDVSSPMDSPSSPSSSESGSDDGRYSPYKKSRKQKTPEQRQRKKVQNRNAALRYRVKKKDQFQTMNAEADEMEEKNKVLKGKVDGLRTEIDYLKNLMLDVIKARLAKGTLPANFLSIAAES